MHLTFMFCPFHITVGKSLLHDLKFISSHPTPHINFPNQNRNLAIQMNVLVVFIVAHVMANMYVIHGEYHILPFFY